MANKKLPPIPPGEILMDEFLEPMGISQYGLVKDISVPARRINEPARRINEPARRINEIVDGKRSITVDTALRFGRFFTCPHRFG